MTNFNDLARRVMDLAGLSNEQPDLNVAAARIIALEADVARLSAIDPVALVQAGIDAVKAAIHPCAEPCPQCTDRIDALSAADVLKEMK